MFCSYFNKDCLLAVMLFLQYSSPVIDFSLVRNIIIEKPLMDNSSDRISELNSDRASDLLDMNNQIKLFRNPIVQANNKAMPRIYGYRKNSKKRKVQSKVYERANVSRGSAISAELLDVIKMDSTNKKPGQVFSAKSFGLEELADRLPTPTKRQTTEPIGIEVGMQREGRIQQSFSLKAPPKHLVLERLRKLSPLPYEDETNYKVVRKNTNTSLPPLFSDNDDISAGIGQNSQGSNLPQSNSEHPLQPHSQSHSPKRSRRLAESKLVKINSMRNFIVQQSDQYLDEQASSNTQMRDPKIPISAAPVYQKDIQFKVVAEMKQMGTEMQRATIEVGQFDKHTMYYEYGKVEPYYEKLKQSRSLSVASIMERKLPNKQEIPAFVKQYKPMDFGFDLKSISESESFKIILGKGSVYIGEFGQSKPQGLGLLLTPRFTFEGQFKCGQKTRGTQRTSEGTYKGHYFNGLRDGQGQFIWNNGELYSGQWKNGMKHGQGKWQGSSGCYEGAWANNKQQGQGVFQSKSSMYHGEFKNFLKHGAGKEELANGDKYQGQYKEGKPNGFGEYTWKDGSKYSGEFQNGMRHGEGVLQKDGNLYRGTFCSHVRSVGQFKFDFKDGIGQIFYKNGSSFKGKFSNDKPTNQGTYMAPDGSHALFSVDN